MGKSNVKKLSLSISAPQHQPTEWSWAKVPTSMLSFRLPEVQLFMKLSESDEPAETQGTTGLHISKHERRLLKDMCLKEIMKSHSCSYSSSITLVSFVCGSLKLFLQQILIIVSLEHIYFQPSLLLHGTTGRQIQARWKLHIFIYKDIINIARGKEAF